jgi:hypothetical protein
LAEKAHHLLITGTGRAGTSFLVKYLAELGLNTHCDRQQAPHWDRTAQAGLENLPLVDPAGTLPYVIKTPWLTEYTDQILARDDIAVDVVIVPIRNLVEAAASRTVVELQNLHARLPGMVNLDQTWENWGFTPGGTVFSLNPLDQARLLALGFHQLVEHVTKADIPIVFLDFPRIVEDADYLFAKIKSYLPTSITAEQARTAHEAVAKKSNVRIGTELSEISASPESHVQPGREYPTQEQLDGIALRREVRRLRAEVTMLKSELRRLKAG